MVRGMDAARGRDVARGRDAARGRDTAQGSGDVVQWRDVVRGSGTTQVSKGKTTKKKKKDLQKLRHGQAGVVLMKGGDVQRDNTGASDA